MPLDMVLERRAEEVLRDHDSYRLPVDPLAIAREDGVELVSRSFSPGFDGRIRYLKLVKTFVLAYRESGPGRPEGRVRFTVGHELGHLYLHTDYLLSGKWHSSVTNYRSDKDIERQADAFSAALLMPMELFRAEVKREHSGFCDINGLSSLATSMKTSLSSVAIRYCDCDIDPCCIVLSQYGTVLWGFASTDFRLLGMGWIPKGSRVPRMSVTCRMEHEQADGLVEPTVWFERPMCSGQLWEEARVLGASGLTLTLLARDSR
ncbi:ImmA/IrrE family metallo-endopeptidase [bacterium]|nr:ImmA/IrrE family metallo-endopeptidase [bacterium]